MAPTLVRLTMTLAGVALSTSMVLAQQGVGPATVARTPRQPAKAAAPRVARETRSLINGVAVKSDQTPVPNATIRLRNLHANTIEQVVTANGQGEFTFDAVPGVAYVVEIVDEAGRTVAVGDVIVARVGEVAGAKVTVPSGLPAGASVYGETARAVVAAAVGTDLQVIDPSLPKVSPTR